jgi:microcystin-dependent protein
MSQLPQGWLSCNGSQVDRVTYQRLFAAIGTNWGSGDGTTTFHLPAIAPVAVSGISNLHHGIHT